MVAARHNNATALASTASRTRRGRARRFTWSVRLLLHGVLVVAAVWGGPLVRPMAICSIVMAILVDLDGVTRHLLRTAGLALAVWVAASFGSAANASLAPVFGTGRILGIGNGTIALGVGVFLATMLVSGIFTWGLRRRPWLSAFNHAGGGVLGAAEGALLIATLFWAIQIFSEPIKLLAEQTPSNAASSLSPLVQLRQLEARFAEDPAAGLFAKHNCLAALPFIQSARSVVDIACDRSAIAALADSDDLRRLFEEPEFQAKISALREHPDVQIALQERDVAALLRSQPLADLINDPQLLTAMQTHLPNLKTALGETEHAKLTELAANLDADELRRLQRMAGSMLAHVRLGESIGLGRGPQTACAD